MITAIKLLMVACWVSIQCVWHALTGLVMSWTNIGVVNQLLCMEPVLFLCFLALMYSPYHEPSRYSCRDALEKRHRRYYSGVREAADYKMVAIRYTGFASLCLFLVIGGLLVFTGALTVIGTCGFTEGLHILGFIGTVIAAITWFVDKQFGHLVKSMCYSIVLRLQPWECYYGQKFVLNEDGDGLMVRVGIFYIRLLESDDKVTAEDGSVMRVKSYRDPLASRLFDSGLGYTCSKVINESAANVIALQAPADASEEPAMAAEAELSEDNLAHSVCLTEQESCVSYSNAEPGRH